MNSQTLQTVSQLNRSLKMLLENAFSYITVVGEVSNLRRPYSGHLYFSLKDQESQLKCVLFKMQQRYLQGDIDNGQQIICKGRISLYEPRGEYQLIIDSLDFVGSGTLQLAFERLKDKLKEEGVFDPKHKKSLPFMANNIALITSPQGAAVQDFLKIAAGRCPSIPIDIYPVRVQGDLAAVEMIEAIKALNENRAADIIIITRGGGSIEDLWSFNDENLARAIFASSIPIVSAVGHEIDFTIADLVADLRAPTPTAAALAVMPDQQELHNKIAQLTTKIIRVITHKINYNQDKLSYQRRLLHTPINKINNQQLRVEHLNDRVLKAMQVQFKKNIFKLKKSQERLAHFNPAHQLSRQKDHITQLSNRLQLTISHILAAKGQQLAKNQALLKAVSPLAILDRGYAIVKAIPSKKIIKSQTNVTTGDQLEVKLSKGGFKCEVVSVS